MVIFIDATDALPAYAYAGSTLEVDTDDWCRVSLKQLLALADHLGCTKILRGTRADHHAPAAVGPLHLVFEKLPRENRWMATRRQLVSVSCPVSPIRQQRTAEQAECDAFAKECAAGASRRVAHS